MTAQITQYDNIVSKVENLCNRLGLDKYEENKKGRKLAIPIPAIISLAVFKQTNGIPTKRSIYKIFKPDCSYKTLVVNLNRFAGLALLILSLLLARNHSWSNQHIKHTDSTDIPVCLDRNARHHKTMKQFARWAKTGKGWFYGLKLHITTDLEQNLLSVKFTSGNVWDGSVFEDLNKNLSGIFVCDAGYVSEKLQTSFSNNHRIILAASKKNMKKLAADWQIKLLKTRMLIEMNFRNLKLFYGLITSLPRSIIGYLANYIYALLAYQIA